MESRVMGNCHARFGAGENLGRYAKMLQDEKENFFIGTLNSEANAIVVKYGGDLKEKMKQDVIDKYHIASDIFPDAAEEDRQFLQTFSFICLLSFDVYVKKQVIEKLIDGLPKKEPAKKRKD